ncbi:MAG: 30S ribosomal protein S4 [Desulfobacterales bacterium]|nr:30S ribosomal protein S4 [Desulfobacterales bacterium]
MARYIDSVCRLCRRENMKLFLKGDRCYSDKCAYDRRGYPPGQHGQRRGRKVSDYGTQLREKQKVKRMYGLSEKQFRLFFQRADRQKGITGTNLLVSLERRLDNAIFRLGFVNSRAQGRQLVKHNHFLVNGKKVNIPSYLIKRGDVIEVRENSRTIKGYPVREDLTMPIQEQLVVELYSK